MATAPTLDTPTTAAAPAPVRKRAAKTAAKAPAKARPAPVAKQPAGKAAGPAKKDAPLKPAKPVKSDKPAKTAKSAKTAPKGKAAAPAKAPKPAPREVLVRDSFTMPRADVELIAQLKARALTAKRAAKKSELLRAGLQALGALDAKALVAALDRLAVVKAGRPKKKA